MTHNDVMDAVDMFWGCQPGILPGIFPGGQQNYFPTYNFSLILRGSFGNLSVTLSMNTALSLLTRALFTLNMHSPESVISCGVACPCFDSSQRFARLCMLLQGVSYILELPFVLRDRTLFHTRQLAVQTSLCLRPLTSVTYKIIEGNVHMSFKLNLWRL